MLFQTDPFPVCFSVHQQMMKPMQYVKHVCSIHTNDQQNTVRSVYIDDYIDIDIYVFSLDVSYM